MQCLSTVSFRSGLPLFPILCHGKSAHNNHQLIDITPFSAIRALITYLSSHQAHRIISQVVLVGARVFGRATLEAWRQAAATSKYKASVANGADPMRAQTLQSAGLTLEEAAKILNVPVPQRIALGGRDVGGSNSGGGRKGRPARYSGASKAKSDADAETRMGAEGEAEAGAEAGESGVEPQMPAATNVDMEHVMQRFKRLFDQNDPKRGGSFYLQSKVLRARERIEMEVRSAEREAEMEREMSQGGWKPKVFK